VVTHQLQVERRTGKVRRSKTDVLPTMPQYNRMSDSTYKTASALVVAIMVFHRLSLVVISRVRSHGLSHQR